MPAVAISGSGHEWMCPQLGRAQRIGPRYVQSLASWLNHRVKLALYAPRRHRGKNQKVPKHILHLVLVLSVTNFALVLIEMNGIRQGAPVMI